MRIWRDIYAVIPAKGGSQAKSRLAPGHSMQFRSGLARAMLQDVLEALSQTPELTGVVVVTEDLILAEVAASYGARVIKEGARDGQTGAVLAGAQRLRQEGAAGVLAVPGDIPLVTSREVSQLFAVHGSGTAVSMVPAHDHRGTNAILMTPADAFKPAFGNDSFRPHLEMARSLGIEPKVIELQGIGLDIDTASDLDRLMQKPTHSRTWDFLAAQGLVHSQ
jgi:2-phospho-L-lactate guanylyltransferase